MEIAITRSWFGGQVQGFQCARHRHPENPGLLHRVNQMHWKPALALDLGNPRRADPGSFLGQTRSRGRSYERSCMGGRTVGPEVAWDRVQTCLAAEYSQAERHLRRLHKISALEHFSERTS